MIRISLHPIGQVEADKAQAFLISQLLKHGNGAMLSMQMHGKP